MFVSESQLQFGDGFKDNLSEGNIDLVYTRLTKWQPLIDITPMLISIRIKEIEDIIVHTNNLRVLRNILAEVSALFRRHHQLRRERKRVSSRLGHPLALVIRTRVSSRFGR